MNNDEIKEVIVKEYESESLDLLYTALAKSQEEMEVATTDKNNPFFKSKYADLTSIVRASRPCLSKNGLAVIQRVTTNNEDNMYLNTRLCHVSGQWIESKMPIRPTDTKIQSIGSCITYLKRYTLSALIGVATDDANDDDGEAEMGRKDSFKKKAKVVDKRTKKEVDELVALFNNIPDYRKEIEGFLSKKGILEFSGMPKEMYDKVLNIAKLKSEESMKGLRDNMPTQEEVM